MVLLTKNLLGLVISALVIGIPLAILAANNWLRNFAYRIELNWWSFMPFIILIVLLTLFTILSQVYKVAKNTSTESLNNE